MNPLAGNRSGVGRVAIVVTAALVLLVTGCSSESDADIPSALTSAGSDGKDKGKTDPVEFGEKPLWDKKPLNDKGTSLVGFEDTRVLGDKVAYVREDEEYDGHLAVAKAKTGKTLWKLTDGDTIKGGDGLRVNSPGVDPLWVGEEAEALLVGYLKPTAAGEENGIAALSLKDGGMLWHVPVATGPKNTHNLWISATSGSHVAVDVSDYSGEDDIDSLALVDYKKREVAWQKKSVEAAAIIDDTVIVDKVKPDGDYIDQVTVMGLKVSNGETRWELNRDKTPEVLTATTDAVAVDSGGSVLVLEPESGEERAKLKLAATMCRFDGESTLACQAFDEDGSEPTSAISIVEVTGSGAKATQVAGSDEHVLKRIHDGRIFAERSDENGTAIVELDADGDTLGKKLPGELIDITDDYAVVTNFMSGGHGPTIMSVHRVEN